jgi:serine/threonine protein kinase
MGLELPENLRDDLSTEKVLAAANVWNIGEHHSCDLSTYTLLIKAVGTTMFALMNGLSDQPFAPMNFNGPSRHRWKHNDMWWTAWDSATLDYYSEDLIQLVRNCLQDDPKTRPTPQQLLDSIRAPSDDLKCQRLKKARGGTPQDAEDFELQNGFDYIPVDDTYKIGTSYEELR